MSASFIEYQEVTGKVVEHLRFYTNPSSLPEVLVRFEDGTSLSLKLKVGLTVQGELYRNVDHNVETLREYDPLTAL